MKSQINLRCIYCNKLCRLWGLKIILILFSSHGLLAQSDNYWSWNFNTPSMLLAGSVVGGGAGPSSIFYNPSLINHENKPSLSISANLISLQFFNAENMAGAGIHADNFLFKVQPRFLSFVFPNKNEKIGMAVAFLAPVSEEISFNVDYYNSELDIIERTAGPENYSGNLGYSYSYEDMYLGYGISYQLSDRLYVGASSFLSVRLLQYDIRQSAQAYQISDSVWIESQPEARYIAMEAYGESLDYWNLNLVFKTGALYKVLDDHLSIGMNLTIPSIQLYGKADLDKDFTHSNIYYDEENSFTANEVFNEVDKNTRTHVKSPFSAALGLKYNTKNLKSKISFTLEYFNKIDSYAIVSPEVTSPVIPESWEDQVDLDDAMSFYAQAKPVTNFGLGFEQFVSPALSLLGGFRTDFTSGPESNEQFSEEKLKVKKMQIDKYHLTVGLSVQIKKVYIISGLQYTLGRNSFAPQIVNYSDPVEYDQITKQSLQGEIQNSVNMKLNEFAIFFGMSVGLNKDVAN